MQIIWISARWILLLLLLSRSLWSSALWAVESPSSEETRSPTKIIVTASKPTGRYAGPLRIELTASDPGAQIWYTCRRNGTPADLIRYTESITLSKSCALIYFGYVTTELESHIERTDYTILYSDDIVLETTGQILSLVNTGNTPTDVSGWEVITQWGAVTLPAETIISPLSRYTIGKVEPASYELRSPEGYTVSAARVVPLQKSTFVSRSRSIAPSTPLPPPTKIEPTPEVSVSLVATPSPPSTETTTEAETLSTPQGLPPGASVLKVSATEAQYRGPLIAWILGIILLGWAILQWRGYRTRSIPK